MSDQEEDVVSRLRWALANDDDLELTGYAEDIEELLDELEELRTELRRRGPAT